MKWTRKNLTEKQRLLNEITIPINQSINPVVYLLCELYYQDFLKLIYGVGRGYAYIEDIIYYCGKNLNISPTTVRKELKDMEELDLIKIINNKKRYVVLRRNALGYMKACNNQKDLNLPSSKQLEKSKILIRLYSNSLYPFLLKSEDRYVELLSRVFETFKRTEKISTRLKEELTRYKEKVTLDFENISIDELEQMHIYVKDIAMDKEKINFKFCILDLDNYNKSSILIKINYIIRFLRRLYFEDVERYRQNEIIRQKFQINIQVITTTKNKDVVLKDYLKEAISDTNVLTQKELQRVKRADNGHYYDLYAILEAFKISVRYYGLKN